jgi:hypothetical protein
MTGADSASCSTPPLAEALRAGPASFGVLAAPGPACADADVLPATPAEPSLRRDGPGVPGPGDDDDDEDQDDTIGGGNGGNIDPDDDEGFDDEDDDDDDDEEPLQCRPMPDSLRRNIPCYNDIRAVICGFAKVARRTDGVRGDLFIGF